MTSRVCSKNKEKKAERKNSVKKIDQTGKKKTTQRNRKHAASPGVETGLSAPARNSLTMAPQ